MVRPSSGRKTQWTTKYEFRGFGRAAQAGEKMLALPDLVRKGNLWPTKEKMTMSSNIALVFVAAVIAFASPALAAGNGNRDNEYKSAQYCVPQDDVPGAQSVYC